MPTPSIRKSYLALSGSGRVVMSFDTPRALHDFCAKNAQKGVRLEAYEELIVRKPLVEQRKETGIINLGIVRKNNG